MSSVTRRTIVPSPPNEVWDAVTDPRQLARWLGFDTVSFQAAPGAASRFWGCDGELRQGCVDEVEPERRLAFRWWRAPGFSPTTRVEIELDDLDGCTAVSVTETQLSAAPARTQTPRLRLLTPA